LKRGLYFLLFFRRRRFSFVTIINRHKSVVSFQF
jgi:hypothetical protein